jgi:hypothetical protein
MEAALNNAKFNVSNSKNRITPKTNHPSHSIRIKSATHPKPVKKPSTASTLPKISKISFTQNPPPCNKVSHITSIMVSKPSRRERYVAKKTCDLREAQSNGQKVESVQQIDVLKKRFTDLGQHHSFSKPQQQREHYSSIPAKLKNVDKHSEVYNFTNDFEKLKHRPATAKIEIEEKCTPLQEFFEHK